MLRRKTESLIFIGIILLVIGIAFLLFYLGILKFRIGELWPIFPLAMGLGFYGMFFLGKRRQGYLMPATILTIFSLTFFYNIQAGWRIWGKLWPIAPTSVGIGFYLMYGLGKREREILVPGTILAGIGVIFFLIYFVSVSIQIIWPLVLIGGGGFFLFRYFRKR